MLMAVVWDHGGVVDRELVRLAELLWARHNALNKMNNLA